MAFSIRDEARKNCKITTDIDTFRDRYIEIDKKNNITVVSPGYDIRTFDKNLFLLLSKARKEPFKAKWIMRPYLVSYDFLGTVIYSQLIMYMNNCSLMEEFKDYDFIYIPTNDSILELARAREIDKKLLPLYPTNSENIKALRYYKNFPLSSNEIEKYNAEKALYVAPTTTKIPVIEQKEIILTITSNNITNKYVDLAETPDNPTSNTYIYYNSFSVALKYNFDYVIIENGDGELRRITWNVDDIIKSRTGNQAVLAENSGIRKFIKAGDSIKIKYSRTTYTDGE